MTDDWRLRYGDWAIVTGASFGIGAEFSRQLGRKGLNVILVARREERLVDIARSIEDNFGCKTQLIVQDLSQPDSVEKVSRAVGGKGVGVLVNNAGFGLGGQFHTLKPTRVSQMVRLNCVTPVELTQAFLPLMVERGKGAVIFVASTAAYQPTPYIGVYGATKGFNLLLGESLWEEYRRVGIDVLVLSPGYTKTEFHQVAGLKRNNGYGSGVAQPKDVVDTALKYLGRRPSVIHGNSNRMLTFIQRFLPKKFVLSVTGIMMKKMI